MKAWVVRLGLPGRNSPAKRLHASLLPFVSETLSYPPSSITRFHRRSRSMRRLPTLGSRSRCVLGISVSVCRRWLLRRRVDEALTLAFRGRLLVCPEILRIQTCARWILLVVCSAPYCCTRTPLRLLQRAHRDTGRVSGEARRNRGGRGRAQCEWSRRAYAVGDGELQNASSKDASRDKASLRTGRARDAALALGHDFLHLLFIHLDHIVVLVRHSPEGLTIFTLSLIFTNLLATSLTVALSNTQPSSTMLTLRLAKFSFADDAPVEAQNFNWKHRTQDLVITFDMGTDGSGTSSQVLKILQGTQVLVLTYEYDHRPLECT
jgi:hypothetical protein